MCVFICFLESVIATALGLWNDLRNGNVNISLVLTLFCKRCVFSYVFFIFSYRFVINQKQREHQEIIEFWNWKGAHSVGFNSFFWNACSSQIIVYNISLRNRHAKKLTLANQISSKQWQSLCEINIFTFLASNKLNSKINYKLINRQGFLSFNDLPPMSTYKN